MGEASNFGTPPYAVDAKANLKPYRIAVPQEEIAKLRLLLEDYSIAAPNWENSQADGRFGVTRQWLTNAVDYWQKSYDWKRWEDEFNSFPQYTIDVEDTNATVYTIRFNALFSRRPNAVAIAFFHGWPGSALEFLPLLKLVRKKWHTPKELPYHIIVPDLIGFGFSSPPAKEYDFTASDHARITSRMMHDLGFTPKNGGYVPQGGDVGSFLAPRLAEIDPAVRLVHVNMLLLVPPPGTDIQADIEEKKYTPDEIASLQRGAQFQASGGAYVAIQGTRPATVGFALGSTPVGLLAWIGEKFLQWSDPETTPTLEEILTNVSYYWFSRCYPTSLWIYRLVVSQGLNMWSVSGNEKAPIGYSWFKGEISNPPKPWRDHVKVITWFRAHDKGGHFAALEQPEALWQDVEDMVHYFGIGKT
ncbi:uncharacterized protein A1O5_13362 [Cladophialophora psammophila CBS 110553]|uniref:Epoxide hydrolase N-terminal domain-containing protein n=1 Tax=Cladophialophora psammophila CBS 110553 TaxID=1182543 RepID=W9VD50_9EURO|nr:uncharacterized protein A1O5_13362 [Cladophialophora psammophila CBS 110553]EXJ53373.1 hypothetical protein A1O5_13362 [Cladophialophora psammophila CBS 110553]